MTRNDEIDSLSYRLETGRGLNPGPAGDARRSTHVISSAFIAEKDWRQGSVKRSVLWPLSYGPMVIGTGGIRTRDHRRSRHVVPPAFAKKSLKPLFSSLLSSGLGSSQNLIHFHICSSCIQECIEY
jgi:hypothetical protein